MWLKSHTVRHASRRYDWDLRRLGLVIEANTALEVAQLGSIEAVNERRICAAATFLCTGPNQQYDDAEDCASFLRGLPVGTWDSAYQDNLTCRTLHTLLVPLRPAVHCAHIGKTGGGKCVAHPPSDLFNQDFSTCSA
jgi:hypothetical protein